MKLTCRFLRYFIGCGVRRLLMYIIHYIFFHLHVFEDLVVEAGSQATHLCFFLTPKVIGQVHNLFDLFLAVLTIAIVQLLLLLKHHVACWLRLSMMSRGWGWRNGRLFLQDFFRLLRLKLLNCGLKDLLRGCDWVSLLNDSLSLLLSLLSLSWELGGCSGPYSLLLLSW